MGTKAKHKSENLASCGRSPHFSFQI